MKSVSGQPTLRTHLEEAAKAGLPGYTAEVVAEHAVAALNLLEKHRHMVYGAWVSIVPDPLPACSSASTPPHTHKETTT